MDQLQDYHKTALGVARKAGVEVKEAFFKEKTVELKGSFADLVTETDQRVEKLIIDSFKEKYPTHKFIGEESVADGHKCEWTDDPTWIIDPIDGTSNFVHSIPNVCISIALSIKKEIVVGVVYLPVTDQMFSAVKGKGATLNEQTIFVSKRNDLKDSVVYIEAGNSRDSNIVTTKIENVRQIVQASHGVRALGSAAVDMCMVALGAGEAYVEYGIHVWDIAAAALIITEAGGIVMDPSGGPVNLMSRQILGACHKTVADQLTKLLTHVTFEHD